MLPGKRTDETPAEAIPPEAFGPLTEYQRRYLTQYAPRRLFAVVSWGNAATAWLAGALNSHPDIFCLHAGNNKLWRLAGGSRLDGLDYMRLVGAMGHVARLAGDVHGVSRHEVPALSAALGERFQAVIVVRDPVSRLLSQFALFDRYADLESWGDLSYLAPLIRETGYDPEAFDYRKKLTFHGANMLNTILEERHIAPIFRSEDLTSTPESLLSLVDHISSGTVPRRADWAARTVRSNPENRRAKRNEISAFEEDVIRKVVKDEAWAIYEELGYGCP